MLKRALSLGIVLGLMGGCGNHSTPSGQVKAPAFIGESFIVSKTLFTSPSTNDPISHDGVRSNHDSLYRVGIKKSSLDKEFLFQGSLITQAPIPMFEGLKSRVVAFKSVGDTLYMLEATRGHSVSDSLPQKLILAAFPKLSEDENYLFFDFSKGLNKIYFASDWHGQDFSGPFYQDTWQTIPMDISYIDEAFIDNNELVVKQIGQISLSKDSVSINTPVELRYYLSPYEENPNFQSIRTKPEDFDKFGYFEVAPQYQKQGPEIIYASKFSADKKIVFGISHNTPAEYRQAIKEGVLYWNRAFGEEILAVTDLAPEISAPDYKNNIIQWVDWDEAGFAYADAQMDPRSGEIKHAQVFMTSAFAFGGKVRARRLLTRLKDQLAKEKDHNHKNKSIISLAGFAKTPLCHYEPTQHLKESLESLLLNSKDLDDAAILKVAQDYIREVVAHEVGHTLGLRHNFAGSLHANFPQSMKNTLFAEYLKTAHAPSDIVTSSSVMEYQRFEEAAITGDQLANSQSALDYDQMAIRHLYKGEEFNAEDIPLFCTDSHVGVYFDCNRFDSGRSMVEFWIWQQKDYLKTLPYVLMENYIAAKSPYTGYDAIPLAQATPNHVASALTILSPRAFALQSLQDETKVLSVRRRFGSFNYLNEYEVIEKEKEYLTEEFSKYQVFDRLLNDVEKLDIATLYDKFVQLIDHPDYSKGIGPGGRAYEFTYADKEVMKTQAQLFFAYLQAALAPVELMYLTDTKNISENEIGQKLLEKFTEMASRIVLTINDYREIKVERAGEEVTLKLPVFKYPTSMRESAASLLINRWINPVWANFENTTLKNQLTTLLDEGLQSKISAATLGEYKDIAIREWIADNKKVLAGFDKTL